jgi:hypothetical protein
LRFGANRTAVMGRRQVIGSVIATRGRKVVLLDIIRNKLNWVNA